MAKSPLRTVRLLRSPTAEEPGVLCLTIGKKPVFYTFQEIPCEIGGRGFAIHRLGMGVLYHVRIGQGEDCTCECLGFLRHGHCKHVLGLRTDREPVAAGFSLRCVATVCHGDTSQAEAEACGYETDYGPLIPYNIHQ